MLRVQSLKRPQILKHVLVCSLFRLGCAASWLSNQCACLLLRWVWPGLEHGCMCAARGTRLCAESSGPGLPVC